MKRYPMTTSDCVDILVAMGSGDDDVKILSKNSNFGFGETTSLHSLDEFQFLLSPHTAKASAHEIAANTVRLEFYAEGGLVEGTLQDMLLDRLRMYRGLNRIIPKLALPRSSRLRAEASAVGRVRPVTKGIK